MLIGSQYMGGNNEVTTELAGVIRPEVFQLDFRYDRDMNVTTRP